MISPMTRWRRNAATALLLTASALVLIGCAGQPTPASRYTLPEPASRHMTNSVPQAHQLQVQPVEVASYLDQEGIVMQLSDIELHAANQNLWAEDLGHQLTRRLRQSLANDLPQTTILGGGPGSAGAQQLSISVDQFQGRYDGQAVASGEWQLRDGNHLIVQHTFDVTRPLADDGYPALVRTLGEVWQTVGSQIATDIERVDASAQTD